MYTKTILLVEDQMEFLAIQKMYLERHGYRVLAVEDGLEAVRYAQEYRPHAILMDLSLPSLDGINATRKLKEDPATSAIPVVMLTAHGYGAAGRRAREAGCAAFLAKPCDPAHVLREIELLIGPAQGPVN